MYLLRGICSVDAFSASFLPAVSAGAFLGYLFGLSVFSLACGASFTPLFCPDREAFAFVCSLSFLVNLSSVPVFPDGRPASSLTNLPPLPFLAGAILADCFCNLSALFRSKCASIAAALSFLSFFFFCLYSSFIVPDFFCFANFWKLSVRAIVNFLRLAVLQQ